MTNKIKNPTVQAGVNNKNLTKTKSHNHCTVNNSDKPQYPQVSLTLVTSKSNPMTKSYTWDAQSNLLKDSKCGKLIDGTFDRIDTSLNKLAENMKEFESHHALVHGVSNYKTISVCLKNNPVQGSISRTEDNFKYPENALLLFDYDPSERGKTINSVKDFVTIIESIDPQLKKCAYISKPSASSGIRRKNELIKNNKGFHVYFAIQGDVQQYAKTLLQRLVINNYGYTFISASGSRQVRSIFDAAVHKPERLDFVAPAIVKDPLKIDKHKYTCRPGVCISASRLTKLTQSELTKYESTCEELLNDAKDDAYAARELYLAKRARTTVETIENLRASYQLGDKGEIDFNHPLVKNDGTQFSFSEAIDSEFRYHKLSMRDPFEPEYGEDKAMLFVNKNGGLTVHSYCHGKTTYKVTKDGTLYQRADNNNASAIFRTVEIDEILKEPPPLEWLVEDYILPESQAMIVGKSGVGKTFLTIDLALSIATGCKWNSRQVKQGAVAYINAEGHRSMQYRIKGWEQEHQSLTNAPFLLSQDACDLMSDESINAAIIKLDEFALKHNRNISIIFVDTLHRNMSGDEDRSPDIRIFMSNFEKLCKRYGSAGFVNHHPGHGNQNRGRGSSSMRAALDTELLLEEKKGKISLKCEKLKDGGDKPDPVGYKLKKISTTYLNANGDRVTTCVAEYNKLSGNQIKQLASNNTKPTPPSIILSINALIASWKKFGMSASETDWRYEFNKQYKVNWNSNQANKQKTFKTNSMNKSFTSCKNKLLSEQVISFQNGRWEFTDLKKSTWTDIKQHAVANLLITT